MNLAGFEKIAPYLSSPLMLYCCFGLLILGVLLKYGESKGRLPHLIFFLILLAMGVVIFLGKEDKAIWIPAAITMLGVAAPAALAWKSSTAGANAAVPFDAGRMAEQLYAQLDRKDEQLAAKDEQIKALTEAVAALPQADASPQKIDETLRALEQGDTKQAQAIFAEVAATKEAAGKKNNAEAAEAYRHLGALAYMNNPKEALLTYQKAVELDPDNADGLNRLGILLGRTDQLAQAEEVFSKVLALGEKHQNEEWRAKALGNLGLVFQTRGALDKAEKKYRMSLEISKALGRKEGMANQYGNLGNVYRTRGELDKAEEMHWKALELDDALGRKQGIAADYANLGNVTYTRGELDRAEGMYMKALALYKSIDGKEGIASQYGNLGIVYKTRGELDRAEEMYRKALKLHQALGSKRGMAGDYSNLGLVYEKRGDMEQTEELWQKSLSLYHETGAMQHPEAKKVQQWLNELAQERTEQQAHSADNPR